MPKKRGYYDNRRLVLFLLDRRREMGFLSRNATAKMMGLSPKALSNWEHGRSIPGDGSCRVIAEALGTSENRVREMVGRPSRIGGDEVFPGVKPVLPSPPPRSKPKLNPTVPQQEGPIGLCGCGDRFKSRASAGVKRGNNKCEWCRRDWGYREYLRWCVREGRVLSTLVLSYRIKARGYFRLNGWPIREIR